MIFTSNGIARPGHVIVGNYVTENRCDSIAISAELKRAGLQNSHGRLAYMKAAVVVEKIIKNMMESVK